MKKLLETFYYFFHFEPTLIYFPLLDKSVNFSL